jgi:hypothetical protein
MKKIFRILLIAIFSLALAKTSAFGDSAPQSWIPYPDPAPGFHSIAYLDNSTLRFNYSVLQSSQPSGMILCTSTKDSACAGNYGFVYNSTLKKCDSVEDVDCIDSMQSIDRASRIQDAAFSRYTVANHPNQYPADVKLGIPEGAMPSIWTLPSAVHNGSTDYAVVAGINGNTNGDGSSNSSSEVVAASIIPVKLVDFGNIANATNWGSSDSYDFCRQIQQTPNQKNIECGHVLGPGCLFPTNELGKCYVQDSFPGDIKFSLKIRFSKEPTGWLHGRMTDPDIAINSGSNKSTVVTVTAGTANVPLIYQSGMWANLSLPLKNFWVRCMTDQYCGMVGTSTSPMDYYMKASTFEGNANLNLEGSIYSSGEAALAGIAAVTPAIGDKASNSLSSWSFRTLSSSEMQGSDNCFTSSHGLKGIVTTNSTAYSAGPPSFKDGSLNYQVASPHFNPDGSVFKGTYNLVMKSETARCIYKFSNAPISATISVISSDGSNDVATTVANENKGWLYLSANNFTFSSPTVKVKLTQEAPAPEASPSPSTSPSTTPVAQATTAPVAQKSPAKTTITCIKGKSTKLVTAVKPTCPTGYKRK